MSSGREQIFFCLKMYYLHGCNKFLYFILSSIIDAYQHYETMPMQYTAIFQGCKNYNFQMKNCDIFIIFAQYIDRGYTLEPPQMRRF